MCVKAIASQTLDIFLRCSVVPVTLTLSTWLTVEAFLITLKLWGCLVSSSTILWFFKNIKTKLRQKPRVYFGADL